MKPRVATWLRRPAHSPVTIQRWRPAAGSSLEVSLPFNALCGGVHSVPDTVGSSTRRLNPVATVPGRYVPSSSFLRPRRFAPPRPRSRAAIRSCPGFPGTTLLGFAHPSGSSRFARAPPSPTLPSPPDLLRLGPAFAVALACTEPLGRQGFTRPARTEVRTRIDRRRQRFGFPHAGTRSLMGFSCWDPLPEGGAPSRIPNCQRPRDTAPKTGAPLTRRTLCASRSVRKGLGGHLAASPRFPWSSSLLRRIHR